MMSKTQQRLHNTSHTRADLSLLEKQVVTCPVRFGMIMLSIAILIIIGSQIIDKNLQNGDKFIFGCQPRDEIGSIFCYESLHPLPDYPPTDTPRRRNLLSYAPNPTRYDQQPRYNSRQAAYAVPDPEPNTLYNNQRRPPSVGSAGDDREFRDHDNSRMSRQVPRAFDTAEASANSRSGMPAPFAGQFHEAQEEFPTKRTVNPFLWFIGSCFSLVLCLTSFSERCVDYKCICF